jgi:ketosteroid isomerase-like protein
MIRRNVAALERGDIGPLLAGYADDAILVFPGPSSWGGAYRGKEAIAAFLQRFVRDGITGRADDILVNGPPWRMRIAVLFTAVARDDQGTLIYDNRAVLFARARWGKIVHQEDFEDTHKSEAFERYLQAVRSSPAG